MRQNPPAASAQPWACSLNVLDDDAVSSVSGFTVLGELGLDGSVAPVAGVLPAAIGVGPGAETRKPMAIATGAGMFSSLVLTLLVVPVFYIKLDDALEGAKRLLRRRSRSEELTPASRAG